MPFCTIEEAWSTSIDPSLLNMDNARDPKQDFQSIYLENSELINNKGNTIECKKKIHKNKIKKRNTSRTYNRLPEHSGPNTRFNTNQKRVIHNNQDIVIDKNPSPTISNDLPINEFNLDAYEKLNDDYMLQSEDISSQGSMLNEFKSINNQTNEAIKSKDESLNIINELRKENINLREIINELKNSKSDSSDNFMDLITFIVSGVVVILMMENITSLLRKF
tara:strand:+ start:541 stop:1203 length:663 start_codon:yes stop_codon:yes gene_type:complete